MADQTYFEDVSVGDPIPVLSVTVDETQLFFYSAATYNGHRIHYDKTWATEVEGYPDILVHGPLQGCAPGPRGHRLGRARRPPGQLRLPEPLQRLCR